MIYELFSKRKNSLERSGKVEVYQYDQVPVPLRVQIQQILVDAVGPQYRIAPYSTGNLRHNPSAWDQIHKMLCRELGRHRLCEATYDLAAEGVLNYLGSCSTEEFIDALELCCRYIDRIIGQLGEYAQSQVGVEQDPKEAIKEINYRLRGFNFVFVYEDGEFYRVDSEYVHEEIVKPALKVLTGPNFLGAQSEFISAHGHYRKGEYEQAVVWAARSFESALKGACEMKGWQFEKGARASDLLKIIRSNGLWPDYLDTSFDQLAATLNSGLPKVRNDAGAHGQGNTIRTVPAYIAGYALHLCAAKICLISEAVQSN